MTENLSTPASPSGTQRFENFGLFPELLQNLNSAGFSTPTPIQQATFGEIAQGKDVFAMAETGSGKTAAFVIPILHRMLSENLQPKPNSAVFFVMAPTRELAQQTCQVVHNFGETLGIKAALIIGGEDIEKQKELLQHGVHFVVATPGRLIDLYKQRIVIFQHISGIIFDEADRLFDMGFKDDISFILSKLPRERQILMFSATNNFDVLHTAYRFGAHPEEINLSKDRIVVDQINQSLIHVGDGEKMPVVVGLLKQMPDVYGMIFCNTKNETHVLAKWFDQIAQDYSQLGLDIRAKAISGNLDQKKRTKLVADFREKKINLLICTDVAARGLDISDVNLVINYDLPYDPSSYVHRIGRTGRAGKDGKAISLCGFDDTQNLGPIEEYIKAKIPVHPIADDLLVRDIGPRPRYREEFDQDDERPMGRDQRRGNRRDQARDSRQETRQETRRESRPEARRENNSNKFSEGKTDSPSNQQQSRRNPGPTPRTSKESRMNEQLVAGQGNPPQMDDDNHSVTQRTNNDQETTKRTHVLTVSAKSIEEAKKEAAQKMGLSLDESFHVETIEEGKKGFLGLFGGKVGSYKVTHKPNYEAFVHTYLEKVLNMAGFELSSHIMQEENRMIVDLVGTDEELLVHNRYDLLESLEFLVRKVLSKKYPVPRDYYIDFTVNGVASNRHEARDNGEGQRGRHSRNDRGGNRGRNFDRRGGRNDRFEGRGGRNDRNDRGDRGGRGRGGRGEGRGEGGNNRRLEELALKMKEKAIQDNAPVTLEPMGPRDRRIIHQTLGMDKQVKTASIGDGHFKRIQIVPIQ